MTLSIKKLQSCLAAAEQINNIAATSIPIDSEGTKFKPLYNSDEIQKMKDIVFSLIDAGMESEPTKKRVKRSNT